MSFSSFVHDALIDLFTGSSALINHQKNSELVLPLLKMLPLIHFLRKNSEPFRSTPLDISKLTWSDPLLATETLRDNLKFDSKYLLELLYV